MTSCGCVLAVFTAGLGLLASAAHAQTLIQAPQPLQIVPWQQIAPAPQDDDDTDDQVAAVDPMKDIDVSKLDWSQLAIDETTFLDRPEAAAKRKAAAEKAMSLDWSNQDKGSAAAGVSVKQSVSPFWDARVGADMTVARQPT